MFATAWTVAAPEDRMLTRYRTQQHIMIAIAACSWTASLMLVAAWLAGWTGERGVTPVLMLVSAPGYVISSVLLVARYLGAAVAREVAQVLIRRDDPPDTGGGRVVQFPRR